MKKNLENKVFHATKLQVGLVWRFFSTKPRTRNAYLIDKLAGRPGPDIPIQIHTVGVHNGNTDILPLLDRYYM